MDQTLTILASLPGTKQEEQCPSVVCDINIYLRFYTLLIFTPSVTGECPGSGLTVTNQKRVLTILTNQSRVISDWQWQAGGWLAQRWKCHLVSASRCGSPSGQLIAASHWSVNCRFSHWSRGSELRTFIGLYCHLNSFRITSQKHSSTAAPEA